MKRLKSKDAARSVKTAALFALLAAFALSPMLFSEWGVERMFDKTFYYEAQDTALDGERSHHGDIWEKLALTRDAAIAISVEADKTSGAEDELKKQLAVLSKYGALPRRDFSQPIEADFYKKAYVNRATGLALEGWVGSMYYDGFEVTAFMDAENGAVYDVYFLFYDDADMYGLSPAGFERYFESFSEYPRDENFHAYTNYRGQSVRYFMYSVSGDGSFHEYAFLEDEASIKTGRYDVSLAEARR